MKLNENFLKLFPDDGAQPGGGDQTPEMMSILDPVTKQNVEIPKSVNDLIGHMISTERKITRDTVKKEFAPFMTSLESLKGENEELAKEVEKFKESQMDEKQKATAQAERQQKEIENKMKSLEDKSLFWQAKCFEMQKKDDVRKAIGDVNLRNPEQTVQLFLLEGDAKVEQIFDDTGKGTNEYRTYLKMSLLNEQNQVEEVTGTPSELFSRWVNQPQNQHHIANNLTPGAGSQKGSQTGSSEKTITREAFDKMNSAERAAAIKDGVKIKD